MKLIQLSIFQMFAKSDLKIYQNKADLEITKIC